MPRTDVKTDIVRHLAKTGPCTAVELSTALNLPRKVINGVLYERSNDSVLWYKIPDSKPPRWNLLVSDTVDSAHKTTRAEVNALLDDVFDKMCLLREKLDQL